MSSPDRKRQQREWARRRYREKHGIPLDAPVWPDGWKEPTWQCSRCTEPHAPGSEFCSDHLRTLEELELEEGLPPAQVRRDR